MADKSASRCRAASRSRRRRSRRQPAKGGWQLEVVAHPEELLGPDLECPSVEEVLDAASELDGELRWSEVGSRIVPLLERVRPYPPGYPARVQILLPPGLTVSLGIDIGPAFMHVSSEILEGWSLSAGDVAAQALANLHARAAEVQQSDVVREQIDGVPVGVLQTEMGIGSTLVLAPAELSRIFGTQPQLFVAPMRDLIASLPPAELELAAWLYAEIASQDPNRLHPLAFFLGGEGISVEPLALGAAMRRPPVAQA